MYSYVCDSPSLFNSAHCHIPFKSGTLIRLSDDKVKAIDELTNDDFLKDVSGIGGKFKLDEAVVTCISTSHKNEFLLDLTVENEKVFMDVPSNHPFFVVGTGWSSCDPVKSFADYGLCCSTLKIGDHFYVLRGNQESRIKENFGSNKSIWRPLNEN